MILHYGDLYVIINTIITEYDGHRGWLYTVAVSPNYQRQGIGSKLVRHAERILIAMKCLKINLQVSVSKAEVVEFYRKLGYLVEERVSMGKLIA
ncbi:MAG: GNAT family N-acetyltransferase [Nostoc sp.]|uniref:GNAT family N-acetyltransferase n=1 Tax=Nostoc sp. TaxID=1180 RepID=UPI003B6269D8